VWCSQWLNTVKKDGTTVTTLTAGAEFDGTTKCTWQLKAEDGTLNG